MKLNRKGFTLVELLVTIAIIALVVGFSIFGIINVINNSEEEATVLSESNIKEAASLYSNEMGSSSWKKTNNYDAFCVTVGELMNKGLLDKNGVITEKNITKDTYIIIKRNNVTMAIESEEIVSSNINDDNNKVCTGQIVIDKEDFDRPILGTNVSYTDKIEIPFTSGSSDSGVSSYKCLYGQSSSNVNKEGTIDGNKCVISNLKHNTNYYVLIYMNTNKGSSVLATGENNYSTSDFKETTITQNKNVITIKYSDKDTNGNNINNPSYYFKSTINGTVDNNIEVCTLEEDKYTCTSSTREIKENTWYKVYDSEVKITYLAENNKVTIDTRIYDGSNNYRSDNKDFEINKYIVKFYKNSAQSVGGSTDTYITRYCIAGKNETCSITSPSIEAPTGYTVVGWNTSKN